MDEVVAASRRSLAWSWPRRRAERWPPHRLARRCPGPRRHGDVHRPRSAHDGMAPLVVGPQRHPRNRGEARRSNPRPRGLGVPLERDRPGIVVRRVPGWSAAATWSCSACVLVAPHGAPHALPGPNNPVRIGAVPPALPWNRRAVRNHALAVLRRHLGDRSTCDLAIRPTGGQRPRLLPVCGGCREFGRRSRRARRSAVAVSGPCCVVDGRSVVRCCRAAPA
jgi:hypothetical protein